MLPPPISYAFYAVAGGMTIAGLWYLLRQPDVLGKQPRDRAPSSALLRGWLALLAALALALGLALFASDSGPAAWIWVWRGDVLTSRLIGVILLAIGAVASLRYAGSARVMLAYGMRWPIPRRRSRMYWSLARSGLVRPLCWRMGSHIPQIWYNLG